jgi:cell division protein FtsL
MLRILNAIAIICLIGAAVLVYDVKYQSTYEAQKVARLNNQIRAEREKIAALRAEWSVLSAPARIQGLASRYLGMKPVGVANIDDFASLPERFTVVGDPIGDIINALPDHIGGRRDPIGKIIENLGASNETASPETTGSIAKAAPTEEGAPDAAEAAPEAEDAEPGAVTDPEGKED